jgi:hypothetical protein
MFVLASVQLGAHHDAQVGIASEPNILDQPVVD